MGLDESVTKTPNEFPCGEATDPAVSLLPQVAHCHACAEGVVCGNPFKAVRGGVGRCAALGEHHGDGQRVEPAQQFLAVFSSHVRSHNEAVDVLGV